MLGEDDFLNYKNTETRFHSVAPTLIDCGEATGKFVVFSLFEMNKDPGPIMHFYSCKRGTEVASVKGGEVFIDYVASEQNKANGTLYFLTDQAFYEERWRSYRRTPSIAALNTMPQIMQIKEFSLSNPVKDIITTKDKPYTSKPSITSNGSLKRQTSIIH